MDAFDFCNVKAEKANAMRRYNLLTSIAKTLRIVEICVALVLLSWMVTRLPFAVKISGDYIRKLSGFIRSPLFIFMISNAIIATLMAKSGRITGQNSGGDNAEVELYEELMKNSADRIKSQSENDALSSRVAEEVEYQDKQVISEMNVTAGTLQDRVEMDTCTDADSKAGMDFDFPTTYRRTQSEKLNGDSRKTEPQTLRWSETDKCREKGGRRR